ncbi:Serine/threonine-protein phosphatase 6 regulatory ankyrin repeat subunit, partial [Globisporangium splendens]
MHPALATAVMMLHSACQRGDLRLVQLLLSRDVPVNATNEDGDAPLMVASRNGHHELVRVLLKHGASVDMPDKNGVTPLRCAAEKGHHVVAAVLLENNAMVNMGDAAAVTPLYTAAAGGHAEVVTLLLDNNATVDKRAEGGRTPLFIAAFLGHVKVVEVLLQKNGMIEATDPNSAATPLCAAAFSGHVKVVEVLLKSNASMNARDIDGATPLHHAAVTGHVEVVKLLLQHKSPVDVPNVNGLTPLHLATMKGFIQVVEALVSVMTTVNVRDADGYTPLHIAAEKGFSRILVKLLEKKASVNLGDSDGTTPLILAVWNGHFRAVLTLLQNQASVNTRNADGSTPLLIACQRGYAGIVAVLLKCGARVEDAHENGATSLYIAVQQGHLDIVQMLLRHGASARIRGTSRKSLLHIAAHKGHAEILKVLLQKNLEVDARDENEETPLHVAARAGHNIIVEILIRDGKVTQDAVGASGASPLYLAAQQGHLDIVKTLLQFNVAIDSRSVCGSTPLMVASQKGCIEIVGFLLSRGAQVNTQTFDGATSLMIAADNGQLEVVKKLLQAKASVNTPDYNGKTPLTVAASKGFDKIVAELLSHNAQVNVEDAGGETPLSCAAKNGHTDVLLLLTQSKAAVDRVNQNGTAPLHIAAYYGHAPVVAELLKMDVKVDARNANKETPLHIAASEGHSALVSMLLLRGAEPNIPDAEGNTPLIEASRRGHFDTVTSLLQARVFLSSVSSAGETALIAAASSGNFNIVKTLLEKGASPRSRATNGDTVLICAARRNDASIVRLLMEREHLSPPFVPDARVSVLAATLETLKDYSKGMQEFRAMWEHLASRLTDMFARFTVTQEVPETVVHRYIAIISGCVRLKAICANSSVYSRLVTSRKIVARLHDFHTELSFLQRSLDRDNSVCTDWASAHNADVHDLLEHLRSSVDVCPSLQDERDAAEAMILLQHEVNVHSDKCSPKMLALLEYSLAKVLHESDSTKVLPIPPWFIPRHDLDIDQTEVTQKRRAIPSGWLGSKVTCSTSYATPDHFADEVNRLVDLSHPNLVELYGASHEQLPYLAVFESVAFINLCEFLSIDGNRNLIWQKMHEAALGLKHLHDRGIILDLLRCKQIWIGVDGTAKINAFGALRDDSESTLREVRWQSPECIRGSSPSLASNVYSLSMCMYEALTGQALLSGDSDEEVAAKVTGGFRPELPKTLSKSQANAIREMWASEPTERMNLLNVVEKFREFAEMEKQQNHNTETEATADISKQHRCDLQGYVVPEFASPISDFLSNLKWKCETCQDSRDSARYIFRRLENVYEILQKAHKLPHDAEATKYCKLLLQLERFMRVAIKEDSLLQRAKSKTVWLKSDVFHRDIDELLNLLSVSAPDSVHNWAKQAAERDADIKALRNQIAKLERTDVQDSEAIRIVPYETRTLNEKFSKMDVDMINEATLQDDASQWPAWFIPIHELKYDNKDSIGEGAFGKVYKARWAGTVVVVKFMGYEAEEDTSALENFLHELRVWFPLNHPNVIKLYGACHVGKRFFACELAANGKLDEFLRRDNNRRDKKWRTLCGAARGLQYLHALNIVHNDLKCDNILIHANGDAKIMDFGLSCIPNSAEVKIAEKNMGALRWKSPEYLHGDRLSIASDIYGFGMCILEAVSGEPPWGLTMLDAVVRYKVKRGSLPQRLQSMSDLEWALIEMMCAPDPEHRVKIEFVVENLFDFAREETRKVAPARQLPECEIDASNVP